MASFCNQCGKPLQEGEICTCQQQAANPAPNAVPQFQQAPVQNQMGNIPFQAAPQQGAAFAANSGQMANQWIGSSKNVFTNIVDLFKDPIGTVKRIADENKLMPPMIMVIINIVVIYLVSVISMVTVRIKLGDYAEWISIPYVRIVLTTTILAAIYDFALAGALFLSTKVFFKEETTFPKMLSIVGSKVILDSIFIIIGAIFMILNRTLGMLIIAVGMMFTTIIFIMSFQKISVLTDAKKFYALFIGMVMQTIVMVIIYYMIANSIVSSLTSALSYIRY